jgi:type IV pilus assembly protein PilE
MNAARATRSRAFARAFSVVELMVALVVVAVLLSLAVPSYLTHVLRAQRSEARAALLNVQAAQERFFVQHNHYASELSLAPPGGLGLASQTDGGLYILALDAASPSEPDGFRVTARPRPGTRQAQDERCVELSIDHLGKRSALDAHAADRTAECWR